MSSRRSIPNRSTRTTHDKCSTGLCRACGWDKKRVPTAWREQKSGTPYPCKSPLIGEDVTLRGDDRPSKIVGCATPLGETIFQHGKRGQKYRCQGAFTVRTKIGRSAIETPVPKSVVRARRQHAKDVLCPDAPRYGADMRGFTAATDRDAHKQHRHPFDLVEDLPFPHRVGSTPCCTNSPVNPSKLDALHRAWHESGDDTDFDALANAVRRALPKHLRATTVLNTDRQIRSGIKTVRDRCWASWVLKEESVAGGNRRFKQSVKIAKREMGLLGLPITKGPRSRAVSQDLADERSFLKRVGLASRSQFLRLTAAQQRALVTRTFRRAKRELSFPAGMLAGTEGEELLRLAAMEFHRGVSTRWNRGPK